MDKIYSLSTLQKEDPGNSNFNTKNIPKILGGSTKKCSEVGLALYENTINEVVCVSSTKAAEMTKLLENIHRSVNIGLMNELKQLTEKMDIDLYEIINAAATKAIWLCSVLPYFGIRWTLYSYRSILFNMESARIWDAYKVHRTCR